MGKPQEIKNPLWESGKRLLIVAAILGGLHSCMKPDIHELDDNAAYAPNALQQEFMKLAAEKYDYLALGDTSHRRPEINLFALNSLSVQAIRDGGDKNLFLELDPSKQDYFNALSGRLPGIHADYLGYGAMANSICGKNNKERISKNLAQSIRKNNDVQIITVDQRVVQSKKTSLDWQNILAVTIPVSAYFAVYDCIDTKAFMFESDTGPENILTKSDDKTVESMLGYKGGTIFYGASHLKRHPKENEFNLVQLLDEAGKSVAVINIYVDEAQKMESVAPSDEPDAYFLVTPSENDPDGIHINNPELQDLYNQAVVNVEQKSQHKAFDPVVPVTQFLPELKS